MVARQEGIEPPTHSLEGCCSIQLSYWRFIRDRPALLASSCQVGAPGFEPGTSCSQSRRDTRLRYAPRADECSPAMNEGQPRSSAPSSAATARARWLTAAFSAAETSPNVRPSSVLSKYAS